MSLLCSPHATRSPADGRRPGWGALGSAGKSWSLLYLRASSCPWHRAHGLSCHPAPASRCWASPPCLLAHMKTLPDLLPCGREARTGAWASPAEVSAEQAAAVSVRPHAWLTQQENPPASCWEKASQHTRPQRASKALQWYMDPVTSPVDSMKLKFGKKPKQNRITPNQQTKSVIFPVP